MKTSSIDVERFYFRVKTRRWRLRKSWKLLTAASLGSQLLQRRTVSTLVTEITATSKQAYCSSFLVDFKLQSVWKRWNLIASIFVSGYLKADEVLAIWSQKQTCSQEKKLLIVVLEAFTIFRSHQPRRRAKTIKNLKKKRKLFVNKTWWK